MTIEQLLECPAAELEKMTDEELKLLFAPCLQFVRPPEKKQNEEEGSMKDFSEKSMEKRHTSTTRSPRKNKISTEKQMELIAEMARKKGLSI